MASYDETPRDDVVDSPTPISTKDVTMKDGTSEEKKKLNILAFDETIYGKPTHSTFSEAYKNSKFAVHALENTTFKLIPNDDRVSYFVEEGSNGQRIPIPENVNSIGERVCLATNTTISGDASNFPVFAATEEDYKARIARVKKFEESFQSTTEDRQDFDAFEPVLCEDETILCSLNCSEIVDFPSGTNKEMIKGLVKVAIVRHQTDGLRLLFSIAEGSKSVKAEENFYETLTASFCVCCCYSSTALVGSGKTDATTSGMHMKYRAGSYFGAQFSSLPLSPTLVDAVAYRLSANERQAETHGAISGDNKAKECKCCECCECCKCCDCALPVCCAVSYFTGTKGLHFEAEEVVPVLPEEPKKESLKNRLTVEQNGVQWLVNGQVEDDIYVTLHYRSLLDKDNRSCHMRLCKSHDHAKDYNKAKLFVSILGQNRNRDLKEQLYWSQHAPMHFNVIRAPSLVNNYDSERGVGGLAHAQPRKTTTLGSILWYCFPGWETEPVARKCLPCL